MELDAWPLPTRPLNTFSRVSLIRPRILEPPALLGLSEGERRNHITAEITPCKAAAAEKLAQDCRCPFQVLIQSGLWVSGFGVSGLPARLHRGIDAIRFQAEVLGFMSCG